MCAYSCGWCVKKKFDESIVFFAYLYMRDISALCNSDYCAVGGIIYERRIDCAVALPVINY